MSLSCGRWRPHDKDFCRGGEYHRLHVQFRPPDDGPVRPETCRGKKIADIVRRREKQCIKLEIKSKLYWDVRSKKCQDVASCWLIYLNRMMMHGLANVKCVTVWQNARCRNSAEHSANKGSAVFSSVFFLFYKCAGHFREGFQSMHHSFRLEFLFAQSFCFQVSFN